MSESAELEPWQQRALDNIYKGHGAVQMTGRQTGKSMYSAQAYKRLFDDIFSKPVEALMLSEGKVYGARYYCVEPIGGNWIDMETWCIETFGSSGDSIWGSDIPEPACRWYANNRKFWFRNEADRDLFLLRWR